jgi:hypothetical protein
MATLLHVYALFPVMSSLTKSWGLSLFVWVALMVQTILAIIVDMAYGEPAVSMKDVAQCNSTSRLHVYVIMVVALNKRVLGATNELSQMSVSIAHVTGAVGDGNGVESNDGQ